MELYRLNVNYSERFLAIASGTDPIKGGNNPQKVAETARKKGFVDEGILPFDSTLNNLTEYYAPLTGPTLQKGKEWLNKWSFKHDWLSNGSLIPPETLKKALTYSPLGIAVYAWAQGEDGFYVRPEQAKDIHWVELRGYKDGKYWIVCDSYSPFTKKLAWDYPFYFAKRYFIGEAEECFIIKYLKSLWQ